MVALMLGGPLDGLGASLELARTSQKTNCFFYHTLGRVSSQTNLSFFLRSPLSFQVTLLFNPFTLAAEVDLVSDPSCHARKRSGVSLSFTVNCLGGAQPRGPTVVHRRLLVPCSRRAHTVLYLATIWDAFVPNIFLFFSTSLSFQVTLLIFPSPMLPAVDLVSDPSCNACKLSALPLSFWGNWHVGANARRDSNFHRRIFVVCSMVAHTRKFFAKTWDESRPNKYFCFWTHLSLFRSTVSSILLHLQLRSTLYLTQVAMPVG